MITCIEENLDYARHISEMYYRMLDNTVFLEGFPLFEDAHNVDKVPELIEFIKWQFAPMYENNTASYKAKYDGIEVFLKAAGL